MHTLFLYPKIKIMTNYIKAIVVLIILLLMVFIPVTKTFETTIKASFLNIINEITYPQNWKNWYKPCTDAFNSDSTSYIIHQNFKNNTFTINSGKQLLAVKALSPTLIEIPSKSIFNTSYIFKIIYLNNGEVKVIEASKTSLLIYVWQYLNQTHTTNSFARNLKNYFEDPLIFYGFKIEKNNVVDTTFTSVIKTVLVKDFYKTTLQQHRQLLAYAKEKDLKYRDFPFIIVFKPNRDSVKVTNMLAIIDKKFNVYKYSSYLKMPANGKMLIGYYKGIYKHRSRIYKAMDKYVSTNNQRNIFTPFEKFLNHKIPANDSSVVNMALYYPVY